MKIDDEIEKSNVVRNAIAQVDVQMDGRNLSDWYESFSDNIYTYHNNFTEAQRHLLSTITNKLFFAIVGFLNQMKPSPLYKEVLEGIRREVDTYRSLTQVQAQKIDALEGTIEVMEEAIIEKTSVNTLEQLIIGFNEMEKHIFNFGRWQFEAEHDPSDIHDSTLSNAIDDLKYQAWRIGSRRMTKAERRLNEQERAAKTKNTD